MTGALLAVLLLATAGDAPAVKATVSKSELKVGETFTVELVASGPVGATFTFAKEAGGESVDLRAAAPGASPPPPGVQRYDAIALALGDVELPAIEVPYRLADGTAGIAKTEPVTLHVESGLPKDPRQQKLADIRGPLSLAIGRAFWIALGIVVALVAALAVWLIRRRRPPAAAPAEPDVPPDVEALRALEQLAAAGLVERAEFRAYYIALADVAKRYLERRLHAPVLEMTSAEMAAFLRDHAQAGPFANAMRELAGAADHVKFARGSSLEDEARRHLQAARALVAGIEERLRLREQVA